MTGRSLSSAERALLLMTSRRPETMRPSKIDQRLLQRLWDDDLIEIDWSVDRMSITDDGRALVEAEAKGE